MNCRESLIKIFNKAVKGVEPSMLVKEHIQEMNSNLFKRLFVAGFGKASVQMVRALEEDGLEEVITKGIVITKYGHGIGSRSGARSRGSKIEVFEAGHPVPDENGLRGTEKIIKLLKDADEDSLILCLISGGGSALLVSPYEDILLHDKQRVTELLLKAGADINELNTVRKHISMVKGGKLAEIAYPARVISLILSDVIGDRVDVIASGPTAPDSTTYTDALNVIDKFGLSEEIPERVMKILRRGREGLIPETPKDNSPVFRNVKNIIIGNNLMALKTAREYAEEMDYKADIIATDISGEARDVGRWLADKVKELKDSRVQKFKNPLCLISGGETTVTVKGNGLGGRNMELALAFAIEIEGIDGITFLSAGMDGMDGPTDAAGAIVSGETVKTAKALGLDPMKYLEDNDSYNFFKEIDSLLITGPTGTNVMDIQITLIE